MSGRFWAKVTLQEDVTSPWTMEAVLSQKEAKACPRGAVEKDPQLGFLGLFSAFQGARCFWRLAHTGHRDFNQKSLWFDIYFTTLTFVTIAQSAQGHRDTKSGSSLNGIATEGPQQSTRFPRRSLGNPPDFTGKESEHRSLEKTSSGVLIYFDFFPPRHLFSFEELKIIISILAGKAEKVLNANHIFGTL